MSLRQKLRSSGKLQQSLGKNQNNENTDDVQPKEKTKKIHKSKKQHHRNNELQEENDENDVKQQQALNTQSKSKRSKHKSKKKKREQSSEQVKQQNKLIQQLQEKRHKSRKKNKKHSKKKKKHKQKNSSNSRQHSDQDKIEAIDVELIKVQQPITHSASDMVRKKEFVTYQDSQRIIYLFSLDAGDYKGLKTQLPHVGQKNIRNHLKVLFEHCLDRIIQRVKCSGRKIKEWQPYQKRQIIRQLHRIRSSNRLLSEGNVELRQTFHKIMKTYNHPQILMTDQQITFLYRRIEAFVRGFNQLNFFRKNYYVPPDQQDQRRKPIIQGGYIMQHKVKRQFKKTQKYQPKITRIDPQQLIYQWAESQEKQICILYLDDKNFEFMIENLRAKFGESDKWKDFQILGKKIDHIIKLGLNRLQELTMKPYNRIQKMIEQEKRAKMKEQLKKRVNVQKIKKPPPSKIQDFKQIIYYSPQLKQVKQGGVIKNPSLLLRQVFAHHGQSFKVKQALVHLLVQKYPEQEQIEITLKVIKDFTQWADREEQTNHVTMVRARLPVLDDGTRSKTFSVGQSDSDDTNQLKRDRDQAEIAEGLTLIQDEQEQQLIKRQAQDKERLNTVYFGNGKFDFDSNGNIFPQKQKFAKRENESIKGTNKRKVQQSIIYKEEIIQVYQSQQSQYEGFISNTTAKMQKK